MSSEELFRRDPRENPFMQNQLRGLIALADEASRSVPVREDDDFGVMAIHFLYKQMQHAESVLFLVPRRDACLVARPMIEGLYQLLWASAPQTERAKRWRSFSIIQDWRLIQSRLQEGISVDDVDIRKNEAGLRVFGSLHRSKKPKPSDPYAKNWLGGVTLAEMADSAGRELYDISYVELSDWEHWGLSGIGDSISREDNRVLVNAASERLSGLSLLTACQCLHRTLEIVDAHLSLDVMDKVTTFRTTFAETLNSFYQK